MERLPEAPPGLLKAQWQTFHGKAANLSDKSQTALFCPYMVPLPQAVKAEIGKGGSEKPDYRNLWRVGRIVHRMLFYRRGEKRKYQL